MSKSIDRKIYYYDIDVKSKKDNTYYELSNNDGKNKIKDIFERIKDKNNKYEIEKDTEEKQTLFKQMCCKIDDVQICVFVDEIKDNTISFKLLQIKSDALPHIEEQGHIRKLTDIVKSDINLVEITHCVIFLNKMVMGAEFNFNGARPSTVGTYINYIDHDNIVSFKGKLKNDVYKSIIVDGSFSLFKMSVRNNSTMKGILVDKLGIIGRYFEDIGDSGTIEIKVVRRKSKKYKGFNLPWKSSDEIKDFVDQNKEDIKSFKLKNQEHQDAIDMLSDKLVCTLKNVKTNNRVVDTEEMYKEIKNFYEQNILNEEE